MLHRIAHFLIYRVMGWRLEGRIPREKKKLLLVLLPHTSNWDFVIGILFIWAERLNITLFGKDGFYFFPFKYCYSWFRVIPIRRDVSDNFVIQATAMYEQREDLWTAMAPEGTRSYTGKIRSGYYYLAQQADVDIMPVGTDFMNKKFILLSPRKALPSFEEDAEDLIQFSRKCRGKKPAYSL